MEVSPSAHPQPQQFLQCVNLKCKFACSCILYALFAMFFSTTKEKVGDVLSLLEVFVEHFEEKKNFQKYFH